MRILPGRATWSMAAVAAMAFMVVLLSVLQFRWVGQLSEAERERLKSRLDTSVEVLRRNFTMELIEAVAPWRRQLPEDLRAEQFFGRFNSFPPVEWLETPKLRGVYVTRAWEGRIASTERFDEATDAFVPIASPNPVEDALKACAPPTRWELSADSGPPPPGFTLISRAGHLYLTRAIGPRGRNRDESLRGFQVLDLDPAVLRDHLIPSLVERAFGLREHPDYDVAVLHGSAFLYKSRAELTPDDLSSTDIRVPLLWVPGDRSAESMRMRGRALVRWCGEGGPFELAIRHRAGSVDQAIAGLRMRNLFLSGSVLLLLSLTMTMLLLSARRAQRLARLQMEFAAGVSHELRTPLTVIRSAADNLAEGVVRTPEQVREYGSLIRNEGVRLSELVEETLQYTAMQGGKWRLHLDTLDPKSVVASVLRASSPAIVERGIDLETRLDEPLPAVRGDQRALARCLQNLLANAVKYGGESRWIRVSADSIAGNGKPCVRISVSDRGPGIDPADLPYLFDPYYQGKSADVAKAQGVGLGLSLTKEMMEAMGGRVTVFAAPGRGATFTLHVPLATADADPSPAH